MSRRASLLGFGAAILLLALLVTVVGTGDVLAALRLADPLTLVGVAIAAATWLVSWGLGLWLVICGLDGRIRPWTAIGLYAAAAFANNVTPFGQAGGEPISALLISRTADAEYETGLAAIASVDAINVVPAVGLALAGLGYYASRVTLGRRLRIATGAVVAVGVALLLLGTVGWRYRRPIARLLVSVITPITEIVWSLVPRLTPPGRMAIRHRIENFVTAIERVRADRRRLILVLCLASAGWIAQMAALWLSLAAVGQPVAVAAVVVAIPVGALASVAPVPGGLAGIEATIVGVLVATAGVPPAIATAAVLIHRTGIYWLPTGVGGLVAVALER